MEKSTQRPSCYFDSSDADPFAEPPRFMETGLSNGDVVREIVQMFYEVHGFGVYHPRHVDSLLKEDLFSLSVTPNMGTVSSLTINGGLDSGPILDRIIASELVTQFAPLLQAGQLSAHFSLHLRLTKTIGPLYHAILGIFLQGNGYAREFATRNAHMMRTLVNTLKAMEPVLEAIKAKSLHSHVSITLALDNGFEYQVPDLQKCFEMQSSAADWLEAIFESWHKRRRSNMGLDEA
jgi:hypothetical protein